jgi:protein-tyrosine phosphatase
MSNPLLNPTFFIHNPYLGIPLVLHFFSFTFASMKILMVCLGNICRSPLAEGILQHKARRAGLPWSLDSAGTNNGYHVGEEPHHLSQKVAKLHAIDISHQKARSFTPEDFDHFDKIYAMSKDVLEDIKSIAKRKFDAGKADLLMNELYPGRNMDVPDPWYGAEPGYHEVFKMIDSACEKIIERYGMRKEGRA